MFKAMFACPELAEHLGKPFQESTTQGVIMGFAGETL